MRTPSRTATVLLATGAMLAAGPPAEANPAASADAEQHAREEIARLEAGVARRARHLVRWLAVPAGALAGWLVVRRRARG
jgi:hypothetical protein